MAGSLGFASRLGGRGSVTAEQAAAQMYSNGIVSGFVVSPATPTANMTVKVGGVAGTPDVMVATNAVGNNVFLKNRNTDAFTLSMTAPASNSVIYAIVGFTDDLSVATTDATSISDNPSKCGLIAVAGTSAASPVAPSDAQIRTAITSAGFTGSQAAYGVLGYVTLASTTTTITAPNISQVGCTTPLSVAKINGGSTAGVLTTNASGVVSPGGNYSTSEVATNTTWVDGKAIYKKTINGTINFAASTRVITTVATGISTIDKLIDVQGFYDRGHSTLGQRNYVTFGGGWESSSPGSQAVVFGGYYDSASQNFIMVTKSDIAGTSKEYSLTLFYTKV